MNDLYRQLAPISQPAWQEIDQEATRVLKGTLTGRKLVDFSGPHGWEKSAVNVGRVEPVDSPPRDGVAARLRDVQPLVELRTPMSLSRREIEAATRGADDPDLGPVTRAARSASMAEDNAIFHGYGAAKIEGIFEASAMLETDVAAEIDTFPRIVAEAVDRLRIEGVGGPYGIAVGRSCYTALATTRVDGYPIIEDIDRMIDGPVVWAPGVDGAVVASLRGGDFELTVGQDFSIGYLGHDADTVELYLQESLTFRVLGPEAAVPLPTVCT